MAPPRNTPCADRRIVRTGPPRSQRKDLAIHLKSPVT
jgi:hypothetical protein